MSGLTYHSNHVSVAQSQVKNKIQGFLLPVKSAIAPKIGAEKATASPDTLKVQAHWAVPETLSVAIISVK